jgi:hypothetical protein
LLALHRRHRPLTATLTTGERLVQRQLAATTTFVITSRLDLGRLFTGFAFTVGLARGRRGASLANFAFADSLGRGATAGLFGFDTLALFFFGLGAGFLFALAVFPFLGFCLGTSALALFRTFTLFDLTLSDFFRLSCLGESKRLHPAFKLGIRNACGALRGIARDRSRRRSGGLGRGAGLGDHNALALGFHHDALGPAMAEALLHAPRTGAAETQGLFAVVIGHLATFSFPAAGSPPSFARKPLSFAASSTTRLLSPPVASAPCITL